jgi:DNA-directed RNA polymerase specialized sigma24 family protein
MEPESTCWTLIRAAARGSESERVTFADRYRHVVLAYLDARWRGPPFQGEIEDAIQDVFVECFREDGALARVRQGDAPGGFRRFLHGVVKNVARRYERKRERRRERQPETGVGLSNVAAEEASLTEVFDRAWAASLLRQALELHQERARDQGLDARRRVELLDLHYGQGVDIKEIARRWEEEPERLYYERKKACREFESVLKEVVAFHHPNPAGFGEEFSRFLEFFA